MKFYFELEDVQFQPLKPIGTEALFSFMRGNLDVRNGQEIPRYLVSIRAVITYEGKTFTKRYACYYYGASFLFHRGPHFLYKTWTIESPYLQFSTKQENQKNKRKIRKGLSSFLDEIEQTFILPNETKNRPLLSKVLITKTSDELFSVQFYLRNQQGKFTCSLEYQKEWEMGTIFQVKGKNIRSYPKAKTVFWRDHLLVQLVEVLRTKSKYRIKYVLCRDKCYAYKGFVPSCYPLNKAKIAYK